MKARRLSPGFKDLLSIFNAHRVEYLVSALGAFGAPLQDLQETDLLRPGLVFQIGVAPLRIDVLTAIDAVQFEEAWRDRITATFFRVSAIDVGVSEKWI